MALLLRDEIIKVESGKSFVWHAGQAFLSLTFFCETRATSPVYWSGVICIRGRWESRAPWGRWFIHFESKTQNLQRERERDCRALWISRFCLSPRPTERESFSLTRWITASLSNYPTWQPDANVHTRAPRSDVSKVSLRTGFLSFCSFLHTTLASEKTRDRSRTPSRVTSGYEVYRVKGHSVTSENRRWIEICYKNNIGPHLWNAQFFDTFAQKYFLHQCFCSRIRSVMTRWHVLISKKFCI